MEAIVQVAWSTSQVSSMNWGCVSVRWIDGDLFGHQSIIPIELPNYNLHVPIKCQGCGQRPFHEEEMWSFLDCFLQSTDINSFGDSKQLVADCRAHFGTHDDDDGF